VDGSNGDLAFFELMESHRTRRWVRLMRMLPGHPRCSLCRAPFGGFGHRLVKPMGFGPSRKNPKLCGKCFEMAPEGGVEMNVGVLFADVRGYTALSEDRSPTEVAALLNRFYEAAVEVLCVNAIIDKLVGDQVMALYIPRLLFEGEVGDQMVSDARALRDAAHPWLDIGIGLDYGVASVGNVGSREVKDFTAIGDVVNTAARLQSVANAGEIVISTHVATAVDGAEPQTYDLKGKSAPVEALVLTPTQSFQAAST